MPTPAPEGAPLTRSSRVAWDDDGVHFRARHQLPGPPGAVAEVIADPSFYVGLDLPDVERPEVIDHHSDGPRSVVRLRYVFAGSLDPLARRLIGAHRLSWIQEVRVDADAAAGSLGFEAERDPRRLHGRADFVLRADGDGTVREIDGELVVAVPGVGGLAERRIVRGLLGRLDVEADALGVRLRSTG
jgi:hypothetical protein